MAAHSFADAMRKSWLKSAVSGFLLDVYGVLYDSGITDVAIPGSVEAVEKLKLAGIPFRLCSNTSTRTPTTVAKTLSNLGFNISENEIFSPIPAVKCYLRQHKLRPFIIVDPDVVEEFSEFEQSDPNCVVLGDAQDAFTYSRMNAAFQLLMHRPNTPLISMGNGKYYKEVDGLKLDVGPFTKALEYACDVESLVIGKPSKSFFMSAVESMNLKSDQVVMIGDDIVSDIGGAQACGIRGVQVRTGKYRPQDEPHCDIVPAGYVNNLLEAVELFLASISHTEY
jgi:phospholysine phosphohistidine inorganic pyrophosphate phosphatase